MREALHFLGWRGTPVDQEILDQISALMQEVRAEITPKVSVRYFDFESGFRFGGTTFTPEGLDISSVLASCSGALLLAATLGAQSERLLLRKQAVSASDAVLMDAVLSAAIEAVCDEQEQMLRREYAQRGLYLTDRFSPGYGDMPIRQTREICDVLKTQTSIGLTVSHSGIMIPRKSVTAILGVSGTPQKKRPSACDVCSMRETCTMRNKQ